MQYRRVEEVSQRATTYPFGPPVFVGIMMQVESRTQGISEFSPCAISSFLKMTSPRASPVIPELNLALCFFFPSLSVTRKGVYKWHVLCRTTYPPQQPPQTCSLQLLSSARAKCAQVAEKIIVRSTQAYIAAQRKTAQVGATLLSWGKDKTCICC